MDFHVGQTFGDYSITGLLGAGGMGYVYKVEHRLTKRTEAMKVLAAEFASDIQIQRFEREMRVLARLSHPNICLLYTSYQSFFASTLDGDTSCTPRRNLHRQRRSAEEGGSRRSEGRCSEGRRSESRRAEGRRACSKARCWWGCSCLLYTSRCV